MFGTASVCRLNLRRGRPRTGVGCGEIHGARPRPPVAVPCGWGCGPLPAVVEREQPTHRPSSPLRGIATGVAGGSARADGGRLQICGVVGWLLPGTVPLAITPYKQSLPQLCGHNPTPTAIKPRPARNNPLAADAASLPGCGSGDGRARRFAASLSGVAGGCWFCPPCRAHRPRCAITSLACSHLPVTQPP